MTKFARIIIAILVSTFALFSISSGNSADLPTFRAISRGDLASDSIYFVMTDRFENGKSQNDEAFVGGGIFKSGFDPSSISYWHGGDFVGLTSRLPYIKNLGFTSIWITPPVVNAAIQGDSGGYHGYWGIDFTTIDPHLGTEAEFKNFVTKAHELGMKVIVDIVVNHTADIISSAVGMYTYRDSTDFPYKTSSGKTFDLTKFAGKSNFPQLNPKNSFPYPPLVSTYNKNIKKPAWLNDVSNYHNRGDSTFSGESNIYGDFFGLDDIFTEKPEVVRGMIDLWSSWITKFNIDGYRIDTAKHVNPEFWNAFLPKILAAAKNAGKKGFPIFGEVADSDPSYRATFLANQSFPSVLDFGFQSKAMSFVQSQNQAYKMAELFNTDDYFTAATTSVYGQPTFLGNHDMGRVGYFLYNATFQDSELTCKRSFFANEVLFFSRGAPITYYGDEKGMTGDGGDKAARQDMFATQVPDWQKEYRACSEPIATRSAFEITNPLEGEISGIQSLIRENPALRSGTQQLRIARKSVVAMTRYLDGQEYLVLFNSGEESESVQFSVATDSTWTKIYGEMPDLTITGKNFNVTLPPISTSIFKADKKLASPSTLKVSLAPIDIDYSTENWLGLNATVTGDGYNQVNFQLRVKGSKNWVNLGTADKRTYAFDQLPSGLYRGFVQPRKFKSGTEIEVIAIAKNDGGAIAYSRIQRYKIKY